jgi:hypothetical protein
MNRRSRGNAQVIEKRRAWRTANPRPATKGTPANPKKDRGARRIRPGITAPQFFAPRRYGKGALFIADTKALHYWAALADEKVGKFAWPIAFKGVLRR